MYSHLWNRPAGAHGLAHVEGALLSSDEPVVDSVYNDVHHVGLVGPTCQQQR